MQDGCVRATRPLVYLATLLSKTYEERDEQMRFRTNRRVLGRTDAFCPPCRLLSFALHARRARRSKTFLGPFDIDVARAWPDHADDEEKLTSLALGAIPPKPDRVAEMLQQAATLAPWIVNLTPWHNRKHMMLAAVRRRGLGTAVCER